MSSNNAPVPSSDAMASSKPGLPVLIVDDDLVVLDMLRTLFHEEGFAVVGANNRAAALYLLQRIPVALC